MPKMAAVLRTEVLKPNIYRTEKPHNPQTLITYCLEGGFRVRDAKFVTSKK